jgi:hypothetical protein
MNGSPILRHVFGITLIICEEPVTIAAQLRYTRSNASPALREVGGDVVTPAEPVHIEPQGLSIMTSDMKSIIEADWLLSLLTDAQIDELERVILGE